MTSKEQILKNIRASKPKVVPSLPELDFERCTFDNLLAHFSSVLESVGGKALLVSEDQLENKLKELYPGARNVVCNFENTFTKEDGSNCDTPHELAKVELAVIRGEFGVAENGSIWVKNKDNRHRALYFLAENLILVVNRENIVATMHDAYERITFAGPGYGTFISGPSKTADIEQSLVIGAHGPKSAYVFFI